MRDDERRLLADAAQVDLAGVDCGLSAFGEEKPAKELEPPAEAADGKPEEAPPEPEPDAEAA